MMNDLISICIPTYKRPGFLALALRSCVAQSYRPLEILIGDDSPDDSALAALADVADTDDLHIVYHRNDPALGQNANVAALFQRANGDRLVLLHDDDLLLPGAIDMLLEPWQRYPNLSMTFGQQDHITHDGAMDHKETEEHRIGHNLNDTPMLIEDALKSALLLQIPSDGFMLLSSLARRIGYRSDEEVGVYCDKDFALRVGAALDADSMYYLARPVSLYRSSKDSISNSTLSHQTDQPRAAVAIYESLSSFNITGDRKTARAFLVQHIVDKVVKGYAISRQRRKALSLFLSPAYGWKRRLTGRGLYHLAIIIEPRLDRYRAYR